MWQWEAPLHAANGGRPLILITVCYQHDLQILKLEHCAHALRGQMNVTWIVAEDASVKSNSVRRVLATARRASRRRSSC